MAGIDMTFETGVQQTDKRFIYYALIIAAAALLQYAYSLQNDFVWDSATVFRDDPSIREFKYFPRYFSEDLFRHTAINTQTTESLKYYRPLTKTLHLLEYQVFGSHPLGYNAVNIILNALVSVLGFLLVLVITDDGTSAFLAALLYAVNPSHVEAVSWAYSDSYLLTAFLCLLALLLYHRKQFAFSCAAFAMALFCHESAILFVPVVILHESLMRQEKGWRRFIRTAPYLGLAGIFLIIRKAVVGSIPLTSVGPVALVNTIAVIIKRYVKIFFLPDAPITIYPNALFSRLDAEVAVSYAVVLGLALFGTFLWFRKKDYLFWYLWFFVWISVNFNIGRLGEYLMADKLLYLASFGFCTLIALFAVHAGKYRRIAVSAVVCLIILHAGISFSRTRYWTDDATYFTKASEFAPDFYPVTYGLAGLYVSRGQYNLAVEWYRKTIQSAPRFSPAPYALAGLYASMGRYDEAVEWYRKTIEINPRFSDAHDNLGNVYYLTGDNERAIHEWQRAILNDPTNAAPYYNLGMAMEKRGDFVKALAYYRVYLTLAPQTTPALYSRVRGLEDRERKEQRHR